jgi:hypothetical protein
VEGLHEREHASVRPPADPELLELGCAAESNPGFWRAEFGWLLRQPAVEPVLEYRAPGQPLTLRHVAGQHAARFPLVSGDAEWLQQRSMAVVARRLAPHLSLGNDVSLDVSAVARGESGSALRREQMQLVAAGLLAGLPQALERYGVAPRRLTFSAGADHPGIGALLRLCGSAALGRPRIVIRVPDRLMQALGGAEPRDAPAWSGDAARLWHGLTALAHREPRIRLVLEQTTRPACALAWGERSDAVLPVSQFEVRADTAWLALGVRLDALGFRSLRDGQHELRRLLRAVLRLADNLVEQLDWVSPDLAQDALVNRRLAVHVNGIGDLIDRWGLDPTAFASVNLATRVLALLRRLMVRESNALARERGPFPGLELRELTRTLSRSLGEERARRLLRQSGLRHRHLLVLSPWSVFPVRAPRHRLPAYLHLLPVIQAADTIALHGHAIAQDLPLVAFRRVLQMTWAIARNRP